MSPAFSTSMVRGAGFRLIGLAFVLIFAFLPAASAGNRQAVSGLERELRTALSKGTTGEVLAIIDSLASLNTAAAFRAICKHAFTSDNEDVERGTILRLRQVYDEDGISALAKLANTSKDHRIRICLTFALANQRSNRAFTAVVQNVFDGRDSVAMTALQMLQKADNLNAVNALIDALEDEEKKGKAGDQRAFAVRKTLTALTNEDFEVAADWRNFWRDRAAGFERPAKGERDKEVTTYVQRDSVEWFGMEVNSTRFVFVLDVSGSMKKKDPMPEETETESDGGRRRGGGTTGVGPVKPKPKPKPKFEDIPESRQRLKRVQAELIGVIAKLPREVEFGIVIFNHEVECWSDGHLLPATPANKAKAIKYVHEFQAQGTTQTDEALEKAFGYTKINTIFLLSDGAPRSRDDIKLPVKPILDWVRGENRFRRISINAVTFEQCGKSLRAFMKRLATTTRGQYKELR